MTNARVLVDVLLAAAALTTSFFRAEPATKATGLAAFFSSARAAKRPALPRAATARALVAHGRTYTVTATVYNAVPGQTDAEPFVTADNSLIKPHYGTGQHWMALSNDLLKRWGGKFDYGDQVRVSGMPSNLDGVYTVHYTMNRRHRHCVDVLAHPSEKLDIFCKGVKIQKVVKR